MNSLIIALLVNKECNELPDVTDGFEVLHIMDQLCGLFFRKDTLRVAPKLAQNFFFGHRVLRMPFGDPRRVSEATTVLELDTYWAIGSRFGNRFIDDHRDFAQRILNFEFIGLGIREGVDLQFAVEKGE